MQRHRKTHMFRFPMNRGKSAPTACLGVLMPCYNEVQTANEIIQRILAQSLVAELIIIDDGSTDGSWKLVQRWPAMDRRVRVLRHVRNQGKGVALRHGFEMTKAPVIVVQDADLEYDPTDFMRMLEPILAGASVVYGSRFFPGSRPVTDWWHKCSNRALTLVSNVVTGQHLTDEATCYKMFRREVLLELSLEEDRFGFCPEVTAKLARRGIEIVEVPICYHARSRGEGKKLRLQDGLAALWCLLRYSYGGDRDSSECPAEMIPKQASDAGTVA